MKPLVNLLKIRRHQSHDDSLFTEINKKLVDNIMLGIEEVTGNRGGESELSNFHAIQEDLTPQRSYRPPQGTVLGTISCDGVISGADKICCLCE